MRFLRSVRGVNLRDKIKSEKIWEQMEINSRMEYIQEYQKNLHEHMERMPPE